MRLFALIYSPCLRIDGSLVAPWLFRVDLEAVGRCPRCGEHGGAVCLGPLDGIHITVPSAFVRADADAHDVVAHGIFAFAPKEVHFLLGIDIAPLAVHATAAETVDVLVLCVGVDGDCLRSRRKTGGERDRQEKCFFKVFHVIDVLMVGFIVSCRAIPP